MNKSNRGLIIALQKGYYINKEGLLFNKNNKEIKGTIDNTKYKRFTIR